MRARLSARLGPAAVVHGAHHGVGSTPAGVRLFVARGSITLVTEGTRDLLKRALELPPAERATLVRELRASLEAEGLGEEVDVDPELSAELERRIRDLDEGRVKPIPFDTLLKEVRARIDARRSPPA